MQKVRRPEPVKLDTDLYQNPREIRVPRVTARREQDLLSAYAPLPPNLETCAGGTAP